MVEGHCSCCLASASSLSSEAEKQMKRAAPPDAKNPRCTVPQRNTEVSLGLLQCLPPLSPPQPSNKDPHLGLWAEEAGHWHGPPCQVAQVLPTRLGREGLSQAPSLVP